MKYVVYEIWTKATIVEANSRGEAYLMVEPSPADSARGDLHLSNWHAVPVLEAEGNSNEHQR